MPGVAIGGRGCCEWVGGSVGGYLGGWVRDGCVRGFWRACVVTFAVTVKSN